MTKSEIGKLWDLFHALSKDRQIEILKEYTYYVANYPDDHDEGSYPVCFLEWWTQDYQESQKLCGECQVNTATKEASGNWYCPLCYHNKYHDIS